MILMVEADAWIFEHTPEVWHNELLKEHPVRELNYFEGEVRNVEALYSESTVEKLVKNVDSLEEFLEKLEKKEKV